jgi:hypothetical protein
MITSTPAALRPQPNSTQAYPVMPFGSASKYRRGVYKANALAVDFVTFRKFFATYFDRDAALRDDYNAAMRWLCVDAVAGGIGRGFSWFIFLLLVAIFAASMGMFWMLVRRWTVYHH